MEIRTELHSYLAPSSDNSPLVILDLLIPPYDHKTHTVSYFDHVAASQSDQCITSSNDDVTTKLSSQSDQGITSSNDVTANLSSQSEQSFLREHSSRCLLRVIKEPPDYFCDSLNYDEITTQLLNNSNHG